MFDNFWVVLIVKALLVLIVFLSAPMVVGYMEHKVLAHMQHRLGPMYAGRFHGWAQLIADGVKFVQKEDIIPRAADRWVFALAPAVAMIPYILLFAVIPFDSGIYAENLDVGIFFVLAASSISVIGILMAGWASANKFSLIGALRAAAQLIAYELPLILAAAAVVLQASGTVLGAGRSSLSLLVISESQQDIWFVFPQIVGFGIFMISAIAELTRPPFDMPIADSEIIFGAYTEYSGLRFAFFLLAEYGGIVALSAIASVLYLGAYQPLPFLSFIPGWIWMSGKIMGLSFFIIWLRATYPRLREDQLQRFSWTLLIPLALANIMVTAVIKVATR
ncbi:MAG TPA: NADH-quinone oxidoreductase subunit NuoH [Actinomycetota bacterium]